MYLFASKCLHVTGARVDRREPGSRRTVSRLLEYRLRNGLAKTLDVFVRRACVTNIHYGILPRALQRVISNFSIVEST